MKLKEGTQPRMLRLAGEKSPERQAAVKTVTGDRAAEEPMTAMLRDGREVQGHSSRTFGKVLYWVGLAVSILFILPLPGWAFGGWMGSKAFTSKGRDQWLGRGIGCWLGVFALFLFLLSDKREPARLELVEAA
jgi:hypothetical protein